MKAMSQTDNRYNENGVSYDLNPATGTLNDPQAVKERIAYLNQLDEEGFSKCEGGVAFISWHNVYQLLENPEHQESVKLLKLPPSMPVAPNLKSFNGLSDKSFTITVSGWKDRSGTHLGRGVEILGAVARINDKEALLPSATWQLIHAVKDFAAIPEASKSPAINRRRWAQIRKLAIAAHAGLDNFLSHTIVVTPDKLRLSMRKAEFGGTRVVEVIPHFDGAPSGWLDAFDGYDSVQDRYPVPDGTGLVEVLIEQPVKAVLSEIKRMRGRRVAGSRAEAFIRNPFAVLGEDAAQVLSEEEFEEAREEAGIYFNRFTTQISNDDIGICGVSLLIESFQNGMIVTDKYVFKSPDDLRHFIREFNEKVSSGLQCCAWEGWDLEILGDAEEQLLTLQDALAEWLRPRRLKLSTVYDLSRYSGRIQEIGKEKPYCSPYISKQKDDEGWFPDNVTLGVYWTPEASTEAIGINLTEKELNQLETEISNAVANNRDEVGIPGCPAPIRLSEAQSLLDELRRACHDVKVGAFPSPSKATAKDTRPSNPPSLVLKPNIAHLDYSEERRREVLGRHLGVFPSLPKTLKSEVKLLDHQLKGIGWLQHLWNSTPLYCRGALMADDMGLGKTVQLLTFVAGCFEENPRLEPALIVAPVSLLDNWIAELRKFFTDDAIRVLTLYGEGLIGRKLRRDDLEESLVEQGLTRFLKPGWRGNSQMVLTTYETLRDLEFSFASERWSIMICDEAQKIKNANALVSRAAKKQNVRFKIACTGTPVENSLADLWSLFDFIQPGLLGALNDFGTKYRRPIEAKTDEERARVVQLHNLIDPQLMRRTKQEVAKDLPKKLLVDSCKGIRMSEYQKTLYNHAINLFKTRATATDKKKFSNHLGLLHYLRRICTDPQPSGQLAHSEPFADYIKKSPKMNWLITELKNIRDRNEKAIVFTEFRDIQRIVQSYVHSQLGLVPDIINGDTVASSTSAMSRQKRINAFQSKAGFGVLILSPLAVGFGVNIQAANHVIHYTRTWNPAKEDQATDRAYRIGQDKDVFVYCPTVIDPTFKTFEKKLDELLEWKRGLSGDMLNGSGDLSGNDFDELKDAEGSPVMEDENITIDHVMHMDADAFEVLCQLLWQKQGYPLVYRTKKSGDGGIDVVAIKGTLGALIQAKSSINDGKHLGWEGIKDVVAGEAAYKAKHSGVSFAKISITNQFFNNDAKRQADHNNVALVDQPKLSELLRNYQVTVFELEKGLS
jgi:hypothetical protein